MEESEITSVSAFLDVFLDTDLASSSMVVIAEGDRGLALIPAKFAPMLRPLFDFSPGRYLPWTTSTAMTRCLARRSSMSVRSYLFRGV